MEPSVPEASLELAASQLSLLHDETRCLLEERGDRLAGLRALEHQVAALRNQLRFSTTASLAGAGVLLQGELQQKEEQLDDSAAQRLHEMRESSQLEVVGRETELLRESVRNTKRQGFLLVKKLETPKKKGDIDENIKVVRNLRDKTRVENCRKIQIEIEEEHLGVVRLVKEHEQGLKTAITNLEKTFNRKTSADNTLQLTVKVKAEVEEKVVNHETSYSVNYPAVSANFNSVTKAVKVMDEDIRVQSGLVRASLQCLQELVYRDRDSVLVREELPTRLATREEQLQLVKQRVAREKEEFIEEHAREKKELIRQQQNLHFALASVNMTNEKNKSLQCIQKPSLYLKPEVCEDRKLETNKEKRGGEQENGNEENVEGDPEAADVLGQYGEQESEEVGQWGPQMILAELQANNDEMPEPNDCVNSNSPTGDSCDPMYFVGFMNGEIDGEGFGEDDGKGEFIDANLNMQEESDELNDNKRRNCESVASTQDMVKKAKSIFLPSPEDQF